jgi:Bifunctional DNA primase/polymerase, N-terminal
MPHTFTESSAVPAENSSRATFAEHAPLLRRLGWAVLPAKGKEPLVKHFQRMRSAPALEAVEKWAQSKPEADIVIIAGLCLPGDDGCGIICVDPDNLEAIGQAEEFFGPTPGKVRTRRGKHHYYDGTNINLGKLQTLRDRGFEIDIKHGQSGAAIVAMPPSPHEKEPGFLYAWDGCDASVIADLPPFPVKRLYDLLDKYAPAEKALKNVPPAYFPKGNSIADFRDGSRGQYLNDELVRLGGAGILSGKDTSLFSNALLYARQINARFPEVGYSTLEDEEVVRRTTAVVEDIKTGRIQPRQGLRSTCISDADEVRLFARLSSTGDASFMLLMLLRAEHDARCTRGETFKLKIDAMAEAGVLGNWSPKKYRNARDLLLKEGFIRTVKPARYKTPAEYALCPRALTPGLN